MSFVNTQYFTMAIVVILFISVLLNRLNAGYFKWVKAYWFYDRTWASRLSSFFYLLSMFLLMVSLLDLRGPEKKIKANLPDQKTIIMIDTSSSMLAEDVRPSRFVKALQVARHFIKNAAGHQISVVLFSDIQKRLIPFTDDIDLLDSRLAALEKTNSVSGGSNISQAIEESLQYFEFDSGDDEKAKSGNMLVLTDAEESEGEFKVHIPSNVNLAIVGVGTLKGANIPLRWEDGSFRGYKMFKGQQITTKLDEDYIRKMGKNASSFKYWIANSYSLPTEEIMNFFRASYNKKQSSGDMRVRPVYSHLILIPAILLYCLSVVVGRFPALKVTKNLIIAFILLTTSLSLKAQDEQKKDKPLSPEMQNDLNKIRDGKADRKSVLKVAEKFLKQNDEARATELYSEYSKTNDDEEIRFNHATSLMKSNRLNEAMPIIQNLMQTSKNEDLKNKLRNNLLISTDPNRQKEQNKKNQNKEKNQDQNQQNSDNKENKDNKNQQNQNQSQNKDDKGKDNKSQDKKNNSENKQDSKQNQSNNKDEKNKKEEKNKSDKKDNQQDKSKEDKKEEQKKDEQNKENKQAKEPQSLEEKEKEIEQKRRMTKTPGVIKQILSDDRELQKRMMDTSTNSRGEMKQKRDW